MTLPQGQAEALALGPGGGLEDVARLEEYIAPLATLRVA